MLGKCLWLVMCLLFVVEVVGENLLMPNETWESGYLPVKGEGNELFYFLIKSRDKNESAPLLVWLNGGPGCSSMMGLFTENGPYIVDTQQLKFKRNEYSWNNNTDMLFIDQPLNTGFSTVKDDYSLCVNESCVARDFYSFLLLFLEKYPQYQHRPLYISGESYAGHFIPAIAAHIHRNHNPLLDLRGVLIGNPYTSQGVQVGVYPYFLMENGNMTGWVYLVTKAMMVLCQVGHYVGLKLELLDNFCSYSLGGYVSIPNYYDIRSNKSYHDIQKVCRDKLREPDIVRLIGAKKSDFDFCNNTIFRLFAADFATSLSYEIEYLITEKVETIIFFGNKDYICNWRGGEVLLRSFNWYGQQEFLKVPMKSWSVDSVPKGRYQKYDALNFMIVYDAGHMVPMDQPKAAAQMLYDFIHHRF